MPVITGTTAQGSVLNADISAISDADGLGAFSYQWQAGGTNITGATNQTLTLTAAEIGALLNANAASGTISSATTRTVASGFNSSFFQVG
ncbi:MAG: hypothetical protein HAW58_01905 [Candidatus Thioglobus sp.]|nr:hypothetical protein [Candidatus Thioglobus sp.]